MDIKTFLSAFYSENDEACMRMRTLKIFRL